jgi:hypothetical protein
MLVNSWLYVGIVSYVSASCLLSCCFDDCCFFSLGLCNVLQNVADMFFMSQKWIVFLGNCVFVLFLKLYYHEWNIWLVDNYHTVPTSDLFVWQSRTPSFLNKSENTKTASSHHGDYFLLGCVYKWSVKNKGPVFIEAHHSNNVAIVHTWQM